jgi:hypothetical protein
MSKGIILITSCHKHLNSRVKELNLKETSWPVVIVIGDPFIEKDYILRDDGIMVIKCEDSYIHLFKKLCMATQILQKLYDNLEGFLICGDDVLFNYNKLEEFLLLPNKSDYMGYRARKWEHIKEPKRRDTFMVDYFQRHPDELKNPINGLENINISKFCICPNVPFIAGTIRYLSINSCNKLIDYINNIEWDIFKYDNTFGYITIIEDLAVSVVLHFNNIYPISYNLVAQSDAEFKTGNFVGYTTNKYK